MSTPIENRLNDRERKLLDHVRSVDARRSGQISNIQQARKSPTIDRDVAVSVLHDLPANQTANIMATVLSDRQDWLKDDIRLLHRVINDLAWQLVD
jgi:hypothetical protein